MNQKYLVLNSGSSSLKFQLFSLPEFKVLAKGLVEKIGLDNSELHYETDEIQVEEEIAIVNHTVALERVVHYLLDEDKGVVKSKSDIQAVGHRVVHGGSDFTRTTFIDQAVKDKIRELIPLAPLHNPANLKGIEVAEQIFPNAHQIAAFDTAFHQTMPEEAFTYAIPKKMTEKDQIRVYGFHGLSHKYVSERAREYAPEASSKIISIHLGNGCSMTAIKEGKSIDTSLGFGPVTGLVMGTRTGDIDPVVLIYLMDRYNYSYHDINELITKKSGMLGLTGFSDLREIEERAAKGDRDCEMALDLNAYRVKKYIGSYVAALDGVETLIFTAGIGENSDVLRHKILNNMKYLGIELDFEKNKLRSKNMREIQSENSQVKVLVIPTNEELEIAQQMKELMEK